MGTIYPPLRRLVVPFTAVTWTDRCDTFFAGPGSPGSPVSGVALDGYVSPHYADITTGDSIPLIIAGTPTPVSLSGTDNSLSALVSRINTVAGATVAHGVDNRVRLYHASSIAVDPSISPTTSLRTGITVGSRDITHTTQSSRVLEVQLSVDRTDLLSNKIVIPAGCNRLFMDLHLFHNESQTSGPPAYGGCSPAFLFAFTRAGWGETPANMIEPPFIQVINNDPNAGTPAWPNAPLSAFDSEEILNVAVLAPFAQATESKPLEFDIPMGATGFRFVCGNVARVTGGVSYYPVYPDTISAEIAMGISP